MNDQQHEQYTAYIRDLARRMILADWEIDLSRNRAETLACVNVWDVENYASIRVQWPEFFGKSRDEQRSILVHELLHAHLDRAQRVMEQLASQWGENSACQFAREAHRKEIEICVQRLARILAPVMPLPPKVKA